MNAKHTLITCLAVATFLGGSAIAQTEGKKNRKIPHERRTNVMKPFAEAQLTDEQKTKAKEILLTHAEAMKAHQQEVEALFTAEQKAAQKEARKQAKADGLSGKEAREVVKKALNLDDETKEKLKTSRAAQHTYRVGVQKEIYGLLSDEQKVNVKSKALTGKGKGKKKDREEENDA